MTHRQLSTQGRRKFKREAKGINLDACSTLILIEEPLVCRKSRKSLRRLRWPGRNDPIGADVSSSCE